jgi:hypothetical protein
LASTHPHSQKLLRRYQGSGVDYYDILQASVDESIIVCDSNTEPSISDKRVRLVRGEYKEELEKICRYLRRAYSMRRISHTKETFAKDYGQLFAR